MTNTAERDELCMLDAPEAIVRIVDDDGEVLRSNKFLIESVGISVETFLSPQEFLSTLDPNVPGCILLDLRMPELSGIEVLDRLRERGIDMPIIILTAYPEVSSAVRSMKKGAVDFLPKPVSDQVLIEQVQRAIEKDRECVARRQRVMSVRQMHESLTARESEVMDLVVEGLSSREIGDQLGVSFKTVEAHRAKIMKKMRAPSIPDLIRKAVEVRGGTAADPNGND
ncbi:response regulator transcription factor [Stratiformator vulcanicus]|uniref:Tetrathionate response regulatory protein TtrR n=1 Tax=Stratiformator vulcanicus TaxID=2527980 RepID=A0A517R0P2_9PLAN|nr:response regulator [Stratiformator vulcanicus]QDT37459.1 Tetrathionate response regulatory protein TtrR [Stratiformator vulcanicus]